MSFTDFLEPCRMMDYVSVSDGMGGFVMDHVPGAEFLAAINMRSGDEMVVAGRTGNKAIFNVMTQLNVELEQNDVFLRLKDGRKYRVTGNAIDMTTPDIAGLKLRQTTAEVLT